MLDKDTELRLLKKMLTSKDSAYSFSYFPVEEYSEKDFDFIKELNPTVKIKFNRGILFDKEVFYCCTEPMEICKVSRKDVVVKETKQKEPKQKEKLSRAGWCYLITDGCYQKIGISSSSVENRIKQLQTGNPRKLSIVAKYQVNTDRYHVEKELHKKFYDKMVSGEWFSSNISEKTFLELCREYD